MSRLYAGAYQVQVTPFAGKKETLPDGGPVTYEECEHLCLIAPFDMPEEAFPVRAKIKKVGEMPAMAEMVA